MKQVIKTKTEATLETESSQPGQIRLGRVGLRPPLERTSATNNQLGSKKIDLGNVFVRLNHDSVKLVNWAAYGHLIDQGGLWGINLFKAFVLH